jgi:hypothetical protein
MKQLLVRAVALAAVLLPAAGAASTFAATWQNVPLPAPPGGRFSVPAGYVSDLKFWAPNRGLMAVAGNASVRAGLYSWDGVSWHPLSTVCGGGVNARIAWAGPTEFWTITEPSIGFKTSGRGLCHYKDGAVVGSYSYFNVSAFESIVNAAACRAPDDCLFGGSATTSADGSVSGAFHLRWDGSSLTPVWNGQGRGVSDLVAHGDEMLESSFVGPAVEAQGTAPRLRVPEPAPVLLHRVSGTVFADDPFAPASLAAVPIDGTELRGMDSDGTTAWAVGGGAGSGPAARAGVVRRPPVAVRMDAGRWQEVALTGATLPDDAWFGDVAAVPGTREAWATLTPFETAGLGTSTSGESGRPSVAHVQADGTVSVEDLDVDGHGAATALACPAADDCWVATARGFVYRRTTAGPYAPDVDPAFQGTITVRPNEAAAQVVPDDPPVDDSRLHAPPVEIPDRTAPVAPAICDAPPALMSAVKASSPKRTRRQRHEKDPKLTLTVRFRLARKAKVGLRARRGGRTVARAKARTLLPGRRQLSVRVRRSTWPKKLTFDAKELTTLACTSSDEGDSLSTGDVR